MAPITRVGPMIRHRKPHTRRRTKMRIIHPRPTGVQLRRVIGWSRLRSATGWFRLLWMRVQAAGVVEGWRRWVLLVLVGVDVWIGVVAEIGGGLIGVYLRRS